VILNTGQATTVADGVNWFRNSSEQIFEVDGEAGTGKSVVLYEIARQCGLKPFEIMPMAYTGQAAIIMRLKGFPHSRSIHSSLYEVAKQEKPFKSSPFITMNTTFNTPEFEYKFRPIPVGGLNPNIKLMIIDEGWMVPDTMRNEITKHGIKILVAGDSGQLPPIGGGPAFLTGNNIHHLTELMRQAKENPIIYIAKRAREGKPIHNGLYGNRVLVINDYELTDRMITDVGNIICGTNKSRDFFNQRTREILNINSPVPMYGERIICRNNNWGREQDNIALANGLAGVVSSPYSINSFNGKTFTIDFLPDLLNSPFRQVDVDYEYLVSSYDLRNQIKNRPYSNGEKFEFAYALTTHLSQGAEFPCGIYFEEFLRSNIQNQLNYTGVTRFKEYLIYCRKTKKFY